MLSRLRSMSGTKLKAAEESAPPAPAPVQTAQPPSKEDILSTLDGFGEKIQGKSHINILCVLIPRNK